MFENIALANLKTNLIVFWQLIPGTCTYPANFNATKTVENKLDQQKKKNQTKLAW